MNGFIDGSIVAWFYCFVRCSEAKEDSIAQLLDCYFIILFNTDKYYKNISQE